MTHYPQSAVGLDYITYPVGPTAAGTTITSHASAHTKGSYIEVVASADFVTNWVQIQISSSTLLTNRRFLLDIATGAAASEVDVIPNLIVEGGVVDASTNGGVAIAFPLAVAAGARVSARCQDSTGSGTIGLSIALMKTGDTPGCAAFTAYGPDTATSNGVAVDPGATANTKGAYAELAASTAEVTQYAVVVTHNNANETPSTAVFAVDIATGAAASEVDLVPDIRQGTAGGTDPSAAARMNKAFGFLTYIPASTRIAIRASCSINDATDRLFRAAIYTSVAPAEPSSGGAFSAAYIG